MTKPRTSYELPCELSEKQIEADFSNFLGHMSSFFSEFSLLDINEQLTGADKMLPLEATAYYLQFKKPTVLRPLRVAQKPRAGEDKRQSIRRFRMQNDLEQTPYSLCFPLRAPAKNASDLQHNILRRLEAPPHSRALYICPLLYSREEYLRALNDEWGPWFYLVERERLLHDEARGTARFVATSAFLRAHAAITPHADVSDWRHYYSFSAHATDVAFHSPEMVARGPSRVSDFIAAEIRRVRAQDDRSTVENLASSRVELAKDLGLGDIRGDDAVGQLQTFGNLLHNQYEIRQFVVLRRKKRPPPTTD